MALHLGPPYHYGLRFDCPECGANIEPDLNVEFLESGLQGKSLEEVYTKYGAPPAAILTLLTDPFVCSNQQKPVRPPQTGAVFLVALVQ